MIITTIVMVIMINLAVMTMDNVKIRDKLVLRAIYVWLLGNLILEIM